MAPVRIGFIGLSTRGWAATALVNPLFDPLLSSYYSLTALCTTSEISAHAAAEKYSRLAGHTVKAYFGDDGVQAIIQDPEVDLVAISVKMPEHWKAVMPAIEAGKDIFIEWTPGVTYDDTVKIAEAAKRKCVRVLVGAQGIQSESMKRVGIEARSSRETLHSHNMTCRSKNWFPPERLDGFYQLQRYVTSRYGGNGVYTDLLC